jgi:rubrerythrin
MTHCYDRSLAMLSTALEMEEKGKSFYEKALLTCHQELGVKIFAMLKKDEDVHVQRIHAIYEQLKGAHAWSEDWKTMRVEHGDLGQIFRTLANVHGQNIKADTGDLEALAVGLDFEFRSVEFYKEQLGQATDTLEKEFIACMIKEEESHHQALSDMKFFLADPAAWFRDHERTAFDGGTAMG